MTMKTNSLPKIVCGLAMGCFFLSFGTLALAHDRQEGPMSNCCAPMRPDVPPHPADVERHIGSALDKLVKAGTITQDQSDKVLTFLKDKDSQRQAEMENQQKFNARPDFITEIKNAADLSDEQANAVAEAIRPPHEPKPHSPCRLPNP